MDEQQMFQLWLALLTLGLGSVGVVVWYFARKVIEMPLIYATKPDLKEVADDWKGEMRQMREERRQDNDSTQTKLDKIGDTVTGIHRRIDSVFERNGGGR